MTRPLQRLLPPPPHLPACHPLTLTTRQGMGGGHRAGGAHARPRGDPRRVRHPPRGQRRGVRGDAPRRRGPPPRRTRGRPAPCLWATASAADRGRGLARVNLHSVCAGGPRPSGGRSGDVAGLLPRTPASSGPRVASRGGGGGHRRCDARRGADRGGAGAPPLCGRLQAAARAPPERRGARGGALRPRAARRGCGAVCRSTAAAGGNAQSACTRVQRCSANGWQDAKRAGGDGVGRPLVTARGRLPPRSSCIPEVLMGARRARGSALLCLLISYFFFITPLSYSPDALATLPRPPASTWHPVVVDARAPDARPTRPRRRKPAQAEPSTGRPGGCSDGPHTRASPEEPAAGCSSTTGGVTDSLISRDCRATPHGVGTAGTCRPQGRRRRRQWRPPAARRCAGAAWRRSRGVAGVANAAAARVAARGGDPNRRRRPAPRIRRPRPASTASHGPGHPPLTVSPVAARVVVPRVARSRFIRPPPWPPPLPACRAPPTLPRC